MEYTAGFDFGTSGVKIAVTSYGGQSLFCVTEEYSIISPLPGFAEQDPLEWWNATCHGLKKLSNEYFLDLSKITAISFSGQMHGLIILDENGDIIRPAIIHCDSRAEKYRSLFSKIELIQSGILNPAFSGFQALSLLWIKDNEPDNFRKIRYIISPKDYIRYRFTGEIATEWTDASATLLFDVANRKWSHHMADKIGIKQDVLTKVYAPYDIAGTVTAKAAEDSGLQKGTTVAFGGADQAMQALGNNAILSQSCTCTVGSGGQLLINTDKPLFNESFCTNTFCNIKEDSWYILGAMLTAGTAYKYMAGVMYGSAAYKDIDRQVEKIMDEDVNVFFFPYLSGERSPYMNEDLTGMIEGISLKTTKAHYMRAVMEGVCFSMRNISENFTSLSLSPKKIIASGGYTYSKLWLKIMASVLSKPLFVPQNKGAGASLGAAMLAGVGKGIYSSIENAAECFAGEEDCVEPDPILQKYYSEKYMMFKTKSDRLNAEAKSK